MEDRERVSRLRADGLALFALVLLLLLGSAALPPSSPKSSSSISATDSETQDSSAKLDPFLRVLSQRAARESPINLAAFAPMAAVSVAAPTANADRIGVLIKTRGPLRDGRVGALSALGDNLYSVRLRPQQLREIAALDQVVFIEANYRLAHHTDISVPAVGGRFLHETAPRATGKDVVVGIIDTGIDFSHLDFRSDRDSDNFEESSRILWLWDQTEMAFVGNPRMVPFGTEYTKEDIENSFRGWSLVAQRDDLGHGTHVAGTLAGDGSASGGVYIGMAPQAEIIAVKTSYFSQDIIEGTRYVFEKAQWLNRPAVVNLSLGGHFGPHDGKSLFEEGLERLLDRPGRVIVASAGNDGDRKVHIGGRLRSRESTSFTFVPSEETAFLTIWYPGDSNMMISVTSPGISGAPQTALAVRGQSAFQRTPDGRIDLDNSSGGPDVRNGDRAIAITLEGVQPGFSWKITLSDQGPGGRYDGWPGLSNMGYFLEGDSEKTVTEPATAEKIIAAGAYATKIFWQGVDGLPHRFLDSQNEGELARFSARGPTRDGRAKPELAAPGTAIVAPLAPNSEIARSEKLVVPGRHYVAMQGTSMAAPHVSGAIALLFQANPRLTLAEVRQQLIATVLQDRFTLSGPALGWGAGKLRVDRGFDALGLVEQLQGGRPALKLGPNPARARTVFFFAGVEPASTVELLVFDPAGRLIYRRALPSGAQRYEWALHDERGERLAPGLYLTVVRADGRTSAPRLLVIQR